MAKSDGINLAVAPRHQKSAAEATKRAVARAKRLGEARVRQQPAKPPRAPFQGLGGAVRDLASALGYPKAVIPHIPPSTEHRFPADPEEDDGKPAKRPHPPKSQIYRVIAGVEQRRCASCKEWLPLKEAFRWRKDRGGMWASDCRRCEGARRREYYYRTQA